MNKPIRTISIFCLLLFLALMANATYLQYYKAGALDEDPRNRRVLAESFSGERGAILVGREAVAESVKSDDQYEFQRQYPQPFRYAPLTGWFSYFSQTGLEKSQNDVLSGDDSVLFVTRLVDLLSNSTPKGGSVQLTIDQDAQDAMFDGLQGLGQGVQAAGVAIEPSTGRILAMSSLPTYDPNELASHDFAAVARRAQQLEKEESQPLLNRATQMRLPPGSTFKVVTAAAAHRVRQLRRRLAGARRADLPAAPDLRALRRDRQRGPRLRHQPDPVQAGDGELLQHHVRRPRQRGRRRRDARDRGGLRLQQPLPRRPRPAGRVQLPEGDGRGRRPGSPASASSRCRPPRCRWRWSPPRSPTAAP